MDRLRFKCYKDEIKSKGNTLVFHLIYCLANNSMHISTMSLQRNLICAIPFKNGERREMKFREPHLQKLVFLRPHTERIAFLRPQYTK